MNLAYLASAHEINFTIPGWVSWGMLISVIIACTVMLVPAFISGAFSAMSGGWMGGGNPFNVTVVASCLGIGLLSGMPSAYIGSTHGVWWGVLAGVVGFVAVPTLIAAASKLSKLSR